LLGKTVIGINQPDKVLIRFDGTEEGYNYLVWAADGALRPLRYDGPNSEASTLFVSAVTQIAWRMSSTVV